jgi:hypothetical protein
MNQHNKPNDPTKKGPFSSVLLESPFTSVSSFQQSAEARPPLSNLSVLDLGKMNYIDPLKIGTFF